MLDSGIDSLSEAMVVPFSPKEEERFILSQESHINGVLERIQYHNFAVIRKIHDWKKFIEGICPRPAEELIRFLIPGRNQENPEMACFEDVAKFYAAYPHGASPQLDGLRNASKSCVSLMHNIALLTTTEHLRNANHHFCNFIELIRYRGEPQMLRDEFAKRLTLSRDNFIRERTANAIEVGKFLEKASEGKIPEASGTPASVRRDDLRIHAVALIKGYRKKFNCTWREATEKVQKVLWRDFEKAGLNSSYNNFRALRHKDKFEGVPPTDDSGLRAAGLEV